MKPRSNTVRKVSKPQKRNTSGLVPFKPGFDPRRNTKGRPKSFDQLRDLFQMIAEDKVKIDGVEMTRAEAIGLAMTSDKKLMREFLEFAYGKVPLSQIVDITSGGKPLNWKLFINGSDSDTNSEADS
jgi:hypothetical protein